MSKPWEKYASASSSSEKPWEKYARPEPEITPPAGYKPSALESFGAGGFEGYTGGFGDEILGAIESPKGAAKSLFGYGSDDPDVKKYQRERDTAREAFEFARKENPISSTAGSITGAVVSPGGKASTALKGGKAVAMAATLGGLGGLGLSDAELADREYGKAALDTAIGASVGGAAQYGANKLGGYLASRGAGAADEVIEASAGSPPPPPGGPGSEKGIGKMQRWARQIFGEAKPVENADEVAAAIKDISGKEEVPAYLLTRDQPTQNLASTLIKQPTIGGRMTRKEVMPIYEGLDKFGKAVANRAGSMSQNEAGKAVKRGAAARFKQMIEPAEVIYQELEEKFAGVPIERVAFKRGMTKLRNAYKTDFSGRSQALLDQIENTFNENVSDVASLRKFRTSIGSYLESTSSKAERDIVGELYGVLTRERDRSILRSAVRTGPKIGRGAKADRLLGGLKQADRIYREAVTEAGEALGVEGRRGIPRATAIRQYLDETPAEQLVKDLFDKGNVEQLNRVRATFPEEFKILKDRAVADLVEASSERGQVSAQRLVTRLRKYSPEVQEILMEDLLPKARSAEKTLDALPRNFNPSDTSTRMEYSRVLSPEWWADNVRSIGQRQILKSGPGMNAVREAAKQGIPNQQTVMLKLSRSPRGQQWAKQLGEAAARGEAAWASTYFLLSKSSPEFRATIEEDDDQ